MRGMDMARPRFTWKPSYESALLEQPAMYSIKYGDSFEQNIPQGINPVKKSWELQFTNMRDSDAQALRAFLKARVTPFGFEPFDFVDPDGEDLIYVCKSWRTPRPGYGTINVTATFDQWTGVL